MPKAWSIFCDCPELAVDLRRDAARIGLAVAPEVHDPPWEPAIEALEQSEQYLHASSHIYYLGRAYEGQGKLLLARQTLKQVVAEELPEDAPATFFRAQEIARRLLVGLADRIPQVTVTGSIYGYFFWPPYIWIGAWCKRF